VNGERKQRERRQKKEGGEAEAGKINRAAPSRGTAPGRHGDATGTPRGRHGDATGTSRRRHGDATETRVRPVRGLRICVASRRVASSRGALGSSWRIRDVRNARAPPGEPDDDRRARVARWGGDGDGEVATPRL
jgi:hypothetical protein